MNFKKSLKSVATFVFGAGLALNSMFVTSKIEAFPVEFYQQQCEKYKDSLTVLRTVLLALCVASDKQAYISTLDELRKMMAEKIRNCAEISSKLPALAESSVKAEARILSITEKMNLARNELTTQYRSLTSGDTTIPTGEKVKKLEEYKKLKEEVAKYQLDLSEAEKTIENYNKEVKNYQSELLWYHQLADIKRICGCTELQLNAETELLSDNKNGLTSDQLATYTAEPVQRLIAKEQQDYVSAYCPSLNISEFREKLFSTLVERIQKNLPTPLNEKLPIKKILSKETQILQHLCQELLCEIGSKETITAQK